MHRIIINPIIMIMIVSTRQGKAAQTGPRHE